MSGGRRTKTAAGEMQQEEDEVADSDLALEPLLDK